MDLNQQTNVFFLDGRFLPPQWQVSCHWHGGDFFLNSDQAHSSFIWMSWALIGQFVFVVSGFMLV